MKKSLAHLLIAFLVGIACGFPAPNEEELVAEVIPLAEDYFDEGYALHVCQVNPRGGAVGFRALCDSMAISVEESSELNITVRRGVGNGNPRIIQWTPAAGRPPQRERRDVNGVWCRQHWSKNNYNSCSSRSVIIIRVHFNDGTNTNDYSSHAGIANVMWNNADSNQALLLASSYGLNDFDQSASDIITVTVPYGAADYYPGGSRNSGTGCAYYPMRDDARAQAQSLGYVMSNYEHESYFIPRDSSLNCGWGGLGQVRGKVTWHRYQHPGVLAHEFGHNFGLGHSATDPEDDAVMNSEYGDKAGVMGGTWTGPPSYTGPHRMIMGWIGDNYGLSRLGALNCASHQNLDIQISRLDHQTHTPSYTNPYGDSLVTFDRSSTTHRYFLSFYSSTDFSGATIPSAWRNQVHIHTHKGAYYEHTFHVKGLLNIGDSFSGTSMGQGFTIELTAKGANSATVRFTLTGCTPPPTTPPPTTPPPTTPPPTTPPPTTPPPTTPPPTTPPPTTPPPTTPPPTTPPPTTPPPTTPCFSRNVPVSDCSLCCSGRCKGNSRKCR